MTGAEVPRRAFIATGTTLAAGLGLSAVLPAGRGLAGPHPASSGAPGAQQAEAGPSGLRASLDPDGSWQVSDPARAWTFSGSVGVPVTDADVASGHDRVGDYREIRFSYQPDGAQPDRRRGGIRVYADTPVALFTMTCLADAPNTAPFPAISGYPALPYRQSYSGLFGNPQFNTLADAADSPWLFFDGNADAFLVSPASHFQQASTTMGAAGTISAGILPSIATLPAGFTQQTLLTTGSGISSVYRQWGSALTRITGKTRPASDDGIMLDKIGYWTDHGAAYWYNFDPSLGYAGTLQAVAAEWAAKGIPIGYMTLDSWWYPKGPNAQWADRADGEYLYEADPALFPDGLAAFRERLGLPLVTHARWIDTSSPYRSQYAISGNVITDPRFWQDRMSYLRGSGVVSFEQDWLAQNAQPAYNLTDPDAFFGNMAASAAANGITIQYCMPLPRDYLQAARYGNVTNIRVSNDRFNRNRWDPFLFASQLAASIGVWPWSDVFMSTETKNLVLSVLSGGPVGVGDPLGHVSKAGIMQAARPDGVLIKPDAPIVPTDQTYIGEAAGQTPPMVAATHTDHDGLRSAYVFAYARQPAGQTATFTARQLGIDGAAYVYDYFAGQGALVPADGSYSATVTSGSYYIVVPVSSSGIAFLGDAGKIVSLGAKRITRLDQAHGSVHATVAFATGEEPVTLHGYAAAAPAAHARSGTAGPVTYDPATGLFSFTLSAPSNERATGEQASVVISSSPTAKQ
jgi:hypothetical protein